MNTTDRMRDVARRLLVKTKSRQVNWIPHDLEFMGCTLYLDKSHMTLRHLKPKALSDTIRIDLYRQDDNDRYPPAAASFEAYVFTEGSVVEDYDDEQQFNDSLLPTELYNEATKVAYHWDEILDDIDNALAQPGRVGLSQSPDDSVTKTPLPSKEPAHAPRR